MVLFFLKCFQRVCNGQHKGVALYPVLRAHFRQPPEAKQGSDTGCIVTAFCAYAENFVFRWIQQITAADGDFIGGGFKLHVVHNAYVDDFGDGTCGGFFIPGFTKAAFNTKIVAGFDIGVFLFTVQSIR